MANVSAERDLDRAKELRRMRKGVRAPVAARALEEAATRLENRAARKLSRLGRRKKRSPALPSGAAAI